MRANRFLLVLLVTAVACACLGCGRSGGERHAVSNGQATAPPSSVPAGASTPVLVNGRSVMQGWMSHWGSDGTGPVEKDGWVFSYKELDGGDPAGSFAANVEGLAPGSIVFFKFCFVDFDGSNLAARESDVDRVIKTAKDRRLLLVLGNALPVRKNDGSDDLLREYAEYNGYLKTKASQAAGLWVYDMYGVLAGADGFLKPGYDSGDSHPNDEGYAALDPGFFELLNNIR